MLQRAQVCWEAILLTLLKNKAFSPDLNLTAPEWEILNVLVEILEPFYQATVATSSQNDVTISKVLPFLMLTSRHMSELKHVRNQIKGLSFLKNGTPLYLKAAISKWELDMPKRNPKPNVPTQVQPTSILTIRSQELSQNPTPTLVINPEHDPLPVQPSLAPLPQQPPAAQTSPEALAEQRLASNLTPSIIS
jgi:hypothetical protein